MAKKSPVTVGLRVQSRIENGYFHVFAYPVVIGPKLSELRDIDAGRPPYQPIAADRVVGFSSYDDPANGVNLNDVKVYSQGSGDDKERRLYAFEVQVEHYGGIDLRKAESAAKTLRTIDGRITKLNAQHGYPATFGQFLLRVASAIGATKFVLPAGRFENDVFARNTGRGQRIEDVQFGAYWVDNLVKEWVEAGKPKPVDEDQTVI